MPSPQVNTKGIVVSSESSAEARHPFEAVVAFHSERWPLAPVLTAPGPQSPKGPNFSVETSNLMSTKNTNQPTNQQETLLYFMTVNHTLERY